MLAYGFYTLLFTLTLCWLVWRLIDWSVRRHKVSLDDARGYFILLIVAAFLISAAYAYLASAQVNTAAASFVLVVQVLLVIVFFVVGLLRLNSPAG